MNIFLRTLIALLLLGTSLTVLGEIAPLMVSPAQNKRVEKDQMSLVLKWRETAPDAKYRLELFFKDMKSPSRTLIVKGRSYRLRFKKLPSEFHWRVRPVGDEKSYSSQIFTVKFASDHPTLIARVYVQQTQSKIDFDSEEIKKTDTISGPALDFHLEYFPKSFEGKYSFSLFGRKGKQSKGEYELSEQKLGLEFGWLIHAGAVDSHKLCGGYQLINSMDFEFGGGTDAEYNVNYASARYLYERKFTENWEGELSAALMMTLSGSKTPSYSLRPLIGKRLNQQWRLDAFVIYESLTSRPEENASKADVDLDFKNTSIGVGVTYRM